MGARTDAKIRDWQIQAGLEPAQGRRAETLARMSELAYNLIRVVELERSGIRDGDGHWYGCDPIDSIIRQLSQVERDDLEAGKASSTDSAGHGPGGDAVTAG